jgi:hypothetical protein
MIGPLGRFSTLTSSDVVQAATSPLLADPDLLIILLTHRNAIDLTALVYNRTL